LNVSLIIIIILLCAYVLRGKPGMKSGVPEG